MPSTPSNSEQVRVELPARGLNRRQFIYTTAVAASSLALAGCAAPQPRYKSPNEKLNMGIIGTSGKGADDLNNFANSENIVALCDVDSNPLNEAAKRFPKAKLYRDYREMLEREPSIDAITVSIPDHQHAPAAMLAIQSGRHVYCQKPLTHTISEARALMLAARKYKVATQMGNQGHADEGYRRLCEMIWSGAIGNVTEAHCWSDRPLWPTGLKNPPVAPVPANLDWKLWLGPAPSRPYSDKWPDGRVVYHPNVWRGWWDFGSGALGDMGCHIMDGACWSLKLGPPSTVEVVDAGPQVGGMGPGYAIIKYQFPARGEMPPVTLTWYDGGKQPAKPTEMEGQMPSNGAYLVGDKGKIMHGTYGENPHLLPESSMADYKRPPQIIPRVPDNNSFKDFIRACKGGPPACSNFDVSAPFTETVILGNLALRVGKKIEWDSINMRAVGCPEADQFIHGHYGKGWKV